MTAVLSVVADEISGEFHGHLRYDSPEWHEARARRVGSSDIAAVVGLSVYDSRFSLYHRKAGLVSEQVENDEMSWGKRLEPAVCQAFADAHPYLDVIEGGTWVDRDGGRVANPDRLAIDRATGVVAVVEAKTAQHDDEWGEPGTDQIPPGYYAQVQHQLDVLGLTYAYVPVLIRGVDFRIYEVPYDAGRAAELREAAYEFLADIAAQRRPDIDEHAQTYWAVRQLHPDIEDREVELDVALAREYLDACDAEKAAKAAKTRATSLVADAMGTARIATCGGDLIALRKSQGGGTPHVAIHPRAPRKDTP